MSGSGYKASHAAACGTNKPLINLTGSAAVRCSLDELTLGVTGTPDDTVGKYTVDRTTTTGTGGTSITEVKNDPLTANNPVGAATGGAYSTADPTEGDTGLMAIALNRRATYRWVANPGRELITVAAANNGIQIECESFSSGTPNAETTVSWYE